MLLMFILPLICICLLILSIVLIIKKRRTAIISIVLFAGCLISFIDIVNGTGTPFFNVYKNSTVIEDAAEIIAEGSNCERNDKYYKSPGYDYANICISQDNNFTLSNSYLTVFDYTTFWGAVFNSKILTHINNNFFKSRFIDPTSESVCFYYPVGIRESYNPHSYFFKGGLPGNKYKLSIYISCNRTLYEINVTAEDKKFPEEDYLYSCIADYLSEE